MVGRQLPGELGHQTGLAGAARRDDGDEAVLGDRCSQFVQLQGPTDERCPMIGQTVRLAAAPVA